MLCKSRRNIYLAIAWACLASLRSDVAARADGPHEISADAAAIFADCECERSQALLGDSTAVSLNDMKAWAEREGSLFLEYVLRGNAGYLFVVGGEGEPRFYNLVVGEEAAKELDLAPGPLTADRMSQALQLDGSDFLPSRSGPKGMTARLSELWQLLVPESERQHLTGGKVKRLVVAADGPLGMFPFEALVVKTGDNPRYLLDVGPPMVYAPSATVLVYLAARPAVPGDPQLEEPEVLTVTDTTDGVVSEEGGVRLNYAGTESRWVAEVYEKQEIAVQALRQEQATEANIRASVGRRRVVHIACNGRAEETDGKFVAALFFKPGPKGAADSADDGMLTFAESRELDLRSCELAILSSSETNCGPRQPSQDEYALSHGFLMAGARRVVASNWLVNDEATASLVSYFCASIAKGEASGEAVDHAAALRQAKRWVRMQAKWSSPYYWGTFVLVGPN